MVSFCVIGKREHGKTTMVKNYLHNHLRAQKKYIFDIQKDYMNVPNAENFTDGNKESFIERVEYVNNSVIVFEEATAFFSHTAFESKLKKILVSSSRSHNNNVIFFCFHSLRTVPQYLIDMVNYFVIFKTNDLEPSVKRKFGETHIYSAWREVMKMENKYSHKIIEV